MSGGGGVGVLTRSTMPECGEGAKGVYRQVRGAVRPSDVAVTKVMSESLALRNYQWQCSRDDPTVDGWRSPGSHTIRPSQPTLGRT